MANILFLAKHYVISRIARRRFKRVGTKLSFSPENSVFRYSTIEIGDNVFIGRDAIFSCEAEIGNWVMFGPRVYITSGRHEYTIIGKRIREQGESGVRKVYVEDDCWIGEGSLICRGVRIGEGTVVGGMSVVSRCLPPYCVCVGIPCAPIKLRYSDEDLEKHLKCLKYSDDEVFSMLRRRKEELDNGGYIISSDGISIIRKGLI